MLFRSNQPKPWARATVCVVVISPCLLLPGCLWLSATIGALVASKNSDDSGKSKSPPPPPPEGTLMASGPFIVLPPAATAMALGNFLPDLLAESGEAIPQLDLAVSFEDQRGILFLRGNGRGGFIEDVTVSVQGRSALAVTSLPGEDGGLDSLLVATLDTLELIGSAPSDSPTALGVRSVLVLPSPDPREETREILVSDVDGDGFREVLVLSSSGRRIHFVSLDEESHQLLPSSLGPLYIPGTPKSMSVADFYPDPGAKKDLAVIVDQGLEQEVLLVFFQRNAGFAACSTPVTPATPDLSKLLSDQARLLVQGDAGFDMDGNCLPDLAFVRADGTSSVFFHVVRRDDPTQMNPNTCLDDFSLPDLVVCDPSTDESQVAFDVQGSGGGHLSPSAAGIVLLHLPGGEAGTWDRATIDSTLGAVVASYFKEGGDEVDTAESYPVPGEGRAIAAGDLDDDGLTDLLALTAESGRSVLSILLGQLDSDGHYRRPSGFTYGEDPAASVVGLQEAGFGHGWAGGDDPFLVAVDRNNEEVAVFYLNPDWLANPGPDLAPVLFEERYTRSEDGLGRRPNGLVVSDLGNDGRSDMVVGTNGGVSFLWSLPPSNDTGRHFRVEHFRLEEIADLCPDGEQAKKLRKFLDPKVASISVRELTSGFLDANPLPDVFIPLRISAAAQPPPLPPLQAIIEDFVLILLNPTPPPGDAFPSSLGEVRLLQTGDDPRHAVVTNLNGDAARDLIVSCQGRSDASEARLHFGDPNAPGNLFELCGDPIPPLSLHTQDPLPDGTCPGTTPCFGNFEFVGSSIDSILAQPESWWLPEFVRADWIAASLEREVVIFPILRLGPSPVDASLSYPVIGEPCSITDALLDPETLLVHDVFQDGLPDLLACDEGGHAMVLIPAAKRLQVQCVGNEWLRADRKDVDSPQRIVPFSAGTHSYIAVANRGLQELRIYQEQKLDRTIVQVGTINVARQNAPGSRLGFAASRGAPGEVFVGLEVEDEITNGVRTSIDLLAFRTGGANAQEPGRQQLAGGGDLEALLLADLDGTAGVDLIACQAQEDGPSQEKRPSRVLCYPGVTPSQASTGSPFELLTMEEGETLIDWCALSGGSGPALLAIATDAAIAVREVPAAHSPAAATRWQSPGKTARRVAMGWLSTSGNERGEPFLAFIDAFGLHWRSLEPGANEKPVLVFREAELGALAIGDVNADGRDDLVAIEPTQRLLHVFLADANGVSFQKTPKPVQYDGFAVPVDLVCLNADGDDWLDVCLGAESGEVRIFRGNGEGDFNPKSSDLYAGPHLEGLRAMDIDGDGKDEILAATEIPGFVILTIEKKDER